MDDDVTLTVAGKSDGFGAQLMAMLSGIAFCRVHGLRYVHTPIRHLLPVGKFATDMDDQVESANAFVDEIVEALGIESARSPDKVEQHLHEVINADPDRYYTPEFTTYLSGGYRTARPAVFADDVTNVAVHVRRGDVGPDEPERWIDFDEVAATMDRLRSRYPDAHFHVFSWMDPCQALEADDVTIHRSESGKDFLHDFNCFVHADVLVVGASCLSLAAALFNPNEIIAPTTERRRTSWAEHAIPTRWYEDPSSTASVPSRSSTHASGARTSNGIVTVDLVGGLGNTLFTVAAAYAFAVERGMEFVISETEFSKGHCSEISPFYPHGWPVYWDTVYRDFEVAPVDTEGFHHVAHWNPQGYVPMEQLVGGEHREVCFHGYFQNVRYFDHVRRELIERVVEPPADVRAYIDTKYGLDEYAQVIVVGVRQSGDYAENGWLLSPSYYRNALLHFPRRKDRVILAVADEPSWVEEHLVPRVPDLVVVDERDNELGHHMSVIQYYLMLRGTDFVLSNSTFHWWPAYLTDPTLVLSPADHRNPYRIALPDRINDREIAALDE